MERGPESHQGEEEDEGQGGHRGEGRKKVSGGTEGRIEKKSEGKGGEKPDKRENGGGDRGSPSTRRQDLPSKVRHLLNSAILYLFYILRTKSWELVNTLHL